MAAHEPPLRITPDMLLSRRLDFERRMRRAPPVTLAIIGVLAVIISAEAALHRPRESSRPGRSCASAWSRASTGA